MSALSIARNRFGLGGLSNASSLAEPLPSVLAQLDQYEALPAPWLPTLRTPQLVQAWVEQQRAVREAPEGSRSGIREAYLRQGRAQYVAAVGARTVSALQSPTGFTERLVHFWSNHFAVSVDKLLVIGLAGGFEADAIRPNILGRFEDLLLAALRHPAMLLYLDQATSLGPNSPAGRRAQQRQQQRRAGLNENLAREILELHTLGVRSGYTQEDVTELARALTGWTLPGEEALEGAGSSFRFVEGLHEPGARTVLGQHYKEEGEQQARAILHALATSPATARNIAYKLARHFVSDTPAPALVTRLSDAFLTSGGQLRSVYEALLRSPEAWQVGPAKFKSPWEWAVSSLRALGQKEIPPNQAVTLMTQLAQPVWRPGSPAGYGDVAATWASPDAVMRRVEVAQRLVAQFGGRLDARELAPRVLPGMLTETTARAIAAAESPHSALALLFVSPEFMRR
jgi:uncharacterized protein (DUF1800 family)